MCRRAATGCRQEKTTEDIERADQTMPGDDDRRRIGGSGGVCRQGLGSLEWDGMRLEAVGVFVIVA